MQNYVNNMRNAVIGFEWIEDAIGLVNKLPNGNELAKELELVKNAIAQARQSPTGNQIAGEFAWTEGAISQAIYLLSNDTNQLAQGNFKSTCKLIISMLRQRAGPVGTNAVHDPFPNLPKSTAHPRYSGHEFQQKTNEDSYVCSGCKMPGCGLRYSCEQNSYNLHPVCATMRPNSPAAGHDLVPNSTFKFHYVLPEGSERASNFDICRRCEACAQPTKGFVYYEEGKEGDRGINFHPCCFKAPRKLPAGGADEYELSKIWTFKRCLVCKEKQVRNSVTDNEGWSYRFKSGEKEYRIHVFCAMNMLLKQGKVGDLSLVMRDTKQPIEKRGIKFCKKVISIVMIVVRLLLGDPIGFLFNVADALDMFNSNQ